MSVCVCVLYCFLSCVHTQTDRAKGLSLYSSLLSLKAASQIIIPLFLFIGGWATMKASIHVYKCIYYTLLIVFMV